MSYGIGSRDCRLAILLKLCYLIPLLPFSLIVGVLWVGIPEVWFALRRLPEECSNVWQQFKRNGRLE